jgi:hypothetical protein
MIFPASSATSICHLGLIAVRWQYLVRYRQTFLRPLSCSIIIQTVRSDALFGAFAVMGIECISGHPRTIESSMRNVGSVADTAPKWFGMRGIAEHVGQLPNSSKPDTSLFMFNIAHQCTSPDISFVGGGTMETANTSPLCRSGFQ